jgi:hypothetical protein
MDTNERKLLFKEEVFQIIACAIEVLNTLGHGIIEKPAWRAQSELFVAKSNPLNPRDQRLKDRARRRR